MTPAAKAERNPCPSCSSASLQNSLLSHALNLHEGNRALEAKLARWKLIADERRKDAEATEKECREWERVFRDVEKDHDARSKQLIDLEAKLTEAETRAAALQKLYAASEAKLAEVFDAIGRIRRATRDLTTEAMLEALEARHAQEAKP